MKIQRSVETTAPPSRVWPLLVQPVAIRRWFTLLESFEYTSDPPHGVGSTFRYEERSGGRLMKCEYRVTEWAEEERFAFTLVAGPMARDDQVWRVEPLPAGSRITLEEDVELGGGIFGRMLLKLGVGRMIGGHLEEMLANLKALAEA